MREREGDSVSLGGDIHKWIKRALVLYKHIEMTGDLCRKTHAHNHVSCVKGMNTCTLTQHINTRVESCGNTLCSKRQWYMLIC